MATAELQRLPTRSVPESGQIVGGKLAGWSFGDPAIDLVRGSELLRMRVTPPGWPFPLADKVTLGAGHFRALRPHRGALSIDVDRQVRLLQEAKK